MIGKVGFLTLALLLSSSVASEAANSFWCTTIFGFCGCDVNVPRDCDVMKRNCKGGTITTCDGAGNCYCPLGVTGLSIGLAPKVLPKFLQRKSLIEPLTK